MISILARINELSRKQHIIGLSVEEEQEQTALRQDYLKIIRGQLRSTLLSVSVVDADGNDVTPEKLTHEKEINYKDNDGKY
ncbi:DUF896 domain-containing protein [Paenibacillus sacheonensis]|uniref:UPF0291 protein GT003_28810 n=1 Tax=Paenibacillus sacheonensis TaxID=742054 RepID=A0A7X4YUS3_9BACL|nr:DUF896 domain-containing protein [Paenibacillus sacheonensis]MBM7569152.1 uncharacterized protein YnzC (UPF0291/DUF896 family) [Paenibacillus sacheonensis]NBC72986.1 DUF896 domain-containing protein [Paenibacillus sacheonensis]